jgi:pimeloyl-ACP methyl ester carboxylesterase
MDFPVQIIVGSQDELTPVAEAEVLRDRIPQARFNVIEGAGHLSNLERPDEFNGVLIDFFRTLK